MSEKRSTYFFSNREDYDEARDHLYRLMYSDYNDSDKIYFYGSWGSEYRIDIYSDCSDPVKVASIIKEHGGKFYDC